MKQLNLGWTCSLHLQAIDLKPVGGIHSMHIDRSAIFYVYENQLFPRICYSGLDIGRSEVILISSVFSRSAARLAMNNYSGAMEDAKEAIGEALRCSEVGVNKSLATCIYYRNSRDV